MQTSDDIEDPLAFSGAEKSADKDRRRNPQFLKSFYQSISLGAGCHANQDSDVRR